MKHFEPKKLKGTQERQAIAVILLFLFAFLLVKWCVASQVKLLSFQFDIPYMYISVSLK